jgi:two-component system CheB/CheR fusion protein
MVMVQNPESAEYDGMPRSAIATGLVDYVLPPDEMPSQLIAYTKHALGHKALPTSPPTPKAASQLKKIFIQLRAKTGHDFTYYKQNTIIRRIERRMAVNQIERLEDYASFLQENPLEIEALFRDLLIGVTSFFRDPEAFNALKDQAIPRLFDKIPRDGAVRVWVPGCSTGEEAYSIAMLIHEYIETQKQNYKVQVFATDIDSLLMSPRNGWGAFSSSTPTAAPIKYKNSSAM